MSDRAFVGLPGSNTPFELPAGWSVEREDPELASVIAPEGDLRIHFARVPRGSSAAETALQAWQKVIPDFRFAVRQSAEVPDENWDTLTQVVYDVPVSENRVVMALIRNLGDRAYVNLADGGTATFARRAAGQLFEIIGGWKPEGLKTPDASKKEATAWAEPQSAELRSFIESGMRDLGIPGVAVAIVQDGRIVFAEGFGVRDIGSDEPIGPSTRFMIGSTTKALTTLMMAKQIEAGRFTWETPLTDLLTTFKLGDEETTRRMRMRDTVSASTGMPRRDMDFIFRYAGISPEERIEQMRTMVPTTAFGETFQYSNLLVAAGGYAAAHAYDPNDTLKSAYENAMADLVFEPLAMNSTVLSQERAVTSEHALPHALSFNGRCERIAIQIEGIVDSVAPAGAVWSTVADIAKYLLMELDAGKIPGAGRYIARDALFERRHGLKIDDKTNYGLGLMGFREYGIDVVGHGGNTLGFTSDMFFIPEKGVGVVMLANRQTANDLLHPLRLKLFEMFFGVEAKAQKAIAATAALREQNLANKSSRILTDAASAPWLGDLVGRYASDDLGPATISKPSAGYRIDFESWGSEIGVPPPSLTEHVLFLTSSPWAGSLRFLVAEDGKSFSLNAGQQVYVFQRRS